MTTAKVAVATEPTLVKGLSLLDSVMLLVGGVIGSGIFLTAGQIATNLRRPDMFILVWVVGGIISLLACFAVAELGGMFPQAGGQYVFLREAYGELPGFLYGWMMFAVVQTGTIAALAVGFAQYFGAVIPAMGSTNPLFAFNLGSYVFALTPQKLVSVTAIALLTFANVVGLRRGSVLVNVATWLKFAAMAALIVLGLIFGKGDWSHFKSAASASSAMAAPPSGLNLLVAFGVALISVLFAFDGWVYVTWVAGEMKDAARNVPRALIIGLAVVAVVYVAMNVIYLYALPLPTIISSDAVVQAAASSMFSPRVGNWLAIMVAVSCFGAMSSAILCTARIFFAMAQDGIFFERMARVHPRWRTPAFSLVAQGIWSAVLALIGLYDQLLTYAIFMMIVSYLATVGALFVLRRKLPDHPRPYRCTGYPIVPALYILLASIWTINTLWQRPKESFGGLLIVLAGVPGYIYWSRQKRKAIS
ncbi:MAG: amino acid/polyamine/organocation transporter, superfamily [Acidobacteriaceae bacterium]|nr:amino acid/polyamine/organocation transporter, superfamily [Acidobacteriaceae bacterium]